MDPDAQNPAPQPPVPGSDGGGVSPAPSMPPAPEEPVVPPSTPPSNPLPGDGDDTGLGGSDGAVPPPPAPAS